MSENAATRPERTASRVTLVPLRPDHAGALHPLLADWEIARMLAELPWPLALADVESYADRASDADAPSEDFTIIADGVPVGCGSVKKPGSGLPPRIMPRLGYWIGRRYWGRGHATAAVGMLVARAFATFADERVGAGVFADNPASLRVLEKLGFERVRVYRTACRARNADVDCIDMQLTRARWARRSDALR